MSSYAEGSRQSFQLYANISTSHLIHAAEPFLRTRYIISQEITSILWEMKFIIVFTKANFFSSHVPEDSYFFETHFDIFLPSMPRSFF